ncbi:hypothetical protein [Sphingobacterium psychroaquaticum]|uniref:hypothetical protein n=1 Tax=Sphingobacterium psychroaquaticum TaxID=561061 RepID=UPI00106CDBEF|nr:hypothetical protein [Sphingobacterium psychroaquaticum]QBQ40079.1 hypothetical protein E2P86_02490 [Sphingobacterium psychroaquaticum]
MTPKDGVAQSTVTLTVDSVLQLQAGLSALDVEMQNNSTTDFTGRIELQLPNGLVSIQDTRQAVLISAGKKRFLSLKFRSSMLSALKDKFFTVRLMNEAGNVVSEKRIHISVPEKRSVVLLDNTPLQYLRQVGDSVSVKLRVFNNGTTDEDVNILFSSPDRLGDRNFKALAISLPAGKDSLLSYSFAIEKYMMSLAQYTIRVSGIYSNSDVFGNVGVLFSNVSSNRDYQKMFSMDNSNPIYSNNYIDLQLNNFLDDRSMYYLRSEGGYRLADGKLRYALNVNQFGDFNSNPNINSTFIEFEKGNYQLTAGNIQENLEAAIYGRGGKVTVWNDVRTNEFSAGIVEKSNDLLGFYSKDNPGFTVFSRFFSGKQENGRKIYDGQIFFDKNGLDSTESILFGNTFDLLPADYDKDMRLTGFVAGGLHHFYGRQSGIDEFRPSGAFGVKLNGNRSKWNYTSDNFYSTAYYPGNRRGAIQLMQRVGRQINKYYYNLGYFYSEFSPKYLHHNFESFSNSTSKFDLNVSLPFSSFLALNVQPSFNQEKGAYWLDSKPVELSIRAWQMMMTANMRSKNYKHNIFLTTESGLISVADRLGNTYAFRGNFSYNYNMLTVFGNYQHGAFQAYELLNSELMGRAVGDRFSFGSSYAGLLFQKKLSWSANASINMTTNFGNTYAGNFNATYKVLKNTMLTATYQYSYTKAMSGYDYTFTNLRAGIRQNLKGQSLDRPVVKSGNLDIFCFYDNNNNGVFDAGEAVAANYNFMVKNVLFVTDKKGKATFKRMPYGDHTLFFPMRDGYQAITKLVEIGSGTSYVDIALQKVGFVKGAIKIDFDANLSVEANLNLDGYRVIAENKEGGIFETKTTETGGFSFNLPKGTYIFYIDTESIPTNISIDSNQQSGTVEVEQTILLDSFILKVKERKVEVKRFGSR